MIKKPILILIVTFVSGFLVVLLTTELLIKGQSASPISSGDPLYKSLSLSKSQKEKIETLNQPFYAKITEVSAQLEEKRAELSNLLEGSDQEKIDAKLSEIASLHAQIQRETAHHLQKVKQTLPPAQRTKFLSLIRKGLCPGKEGKEKHHPEK